MDDQVDEPSDDLIVEMAISNDVGVVCFAGEIDIATGGIVSAACRDAVAGGATRLVLDMSSVTFMDSSGIAALIDTRSIAIVTLRKPSDAVTRLLDATGLSDTFEVEP